MKYDDLSLEELIDKCGEYFYSLSRITKWRATANNGKEWLEIIHEQKKEAVRQLLVKIERKRWEPMKYPIIIK